MKWLYKIKNNHDNGFNGIVEHHNLNWKVEVNFGSLGPRHLGTVFNVWRIHKDPNKNNENGVISGVKGQQGPYSNKALEVFLNKHLGWHDKGSK